jgi:diamine N-acetyltransferase
MIPVSKAGAESIPIIQDLAERTWKVAYASIISAEQMKYMLDLFYSEASLKKQMEDGHHFIIAKEKNKAIGFASYSIKSANEPDTYRLHKIYIDPSWQGKGIGKLLIGFIINDISFNDAANLELNVNRHNKALDFYQKIGFTIVKEEDINIGNGFFMNDYVLNLALQTYPCTS